MSDFEKMIHNMFDHIWDCDINHPVFEDTVGDLMNAVIQCYKNLPSIQPRTGKWIGYNADDKDWQRDDGSPVFMNCSECHGAVINNGSAHWNFCPNCGADMREGDAE